MNSLQTLAERPADRSAQETRCALLFVVTLAAISSFFLRSSETEAGIVAQDPEPVQIAITYFKKLEGSARANNLEILVPQVLAAGLLPYPWIQPTVVSELTSEMAELSTKDQPKPARTGGQRFRYVLEGVIMQKEDKIRIDIVLKDRSNNTPVLSDFVVFEENQMLLSLGDFVGKRLAPKLQKAIAPQLIEGKKIAFAIDVPFINKGNDKKDSFLETTLPFSIIAQLSISKNQLRGITLKRLSPGEAKPEDLDAWVSGEFSVKDGTILVKSVVKERSGLVFPLEVQGSFDRFSDLSIGIADRIVEVLKGRITSDGQWKDQPLLFTSAGPEQYLAEGNKYAEQGDSAAAILMYRKALAGKPDYVTALLRVGDLYVEQKQYKRAIQEYRSALKIDNASTMAHVGLGKASFHLQQYNDAINEYKAAIQLAAKNRQVLFDSYKGIGDTYYAQGKNEMALENYERARKIENNPDLYRSIGRVYVAMGDIKKAIEVDKEALKLFPNRNEFKNDLGALYNRLGLDYYDNQKYDEALQVFKQTLDLNPDDSKVKAEALLYSGVIVAKFHKDRDVKEGLKDVNGAVELGYSTEFGFRAQGLVLMEDKQFEAAVEAFKQALAIEPSYWSYRLMGEAYFRIKKDDLAIESINGALKLQPNNADAHRWLGHIYGTIGKEQGKNSLLEKAISALNKAIELDPDDAWSYRTVGLVYEDLNRWDDAIKSFEEAVRLDPSDYSNFLELGDVYTQTKQYGMAIERLKQAVSLVPDNKPDVKEEAFRFLARAYKAKGEPDKAIANFKKAIQLKPSAKAYVGLAETQKEQMDFVSALGSLKEAIKLDPTYEKAYTKLGSLYTDKTGYGKFRDILEEAIKKDANFFFAYVKLGQVYRWLDDLPKSIKNLEKAVSIVPKDKENVGGRRWAYEELASSYLHAGSYDEAARYYSLAIESQPTAFAYVGLADSYRAIEDYGRAMESAQQAIKLDTKDPSGYTALASVYLSLAGKGEGEEYKRAIDIVRKTIDMLGESWHLHAFLAKCYRLNKEGSKAMDAITQAETLVASESDAAKSWVYAEKALIQIQRKEYERALDSAKTALRLDGNQEDAYGAIGEIYIQQEKPQKAIDELLRYLDKDKNNIYILGQLGFIYQEYTHDYDKAYEMYKKAWETAGYHISIRENFAEANLTTKKFDKAFDLANQVLNDKNLRTEGKLSMKFFAISSLLLQPEKQANAFAELGEFIRYYRSLGEYSRSWEFKGIKNFLKTYGKITPAERKLLLDLSEILESKRPEGIKKLDLLEASLQTIFDELRSGKAAKKASHTTTVEKFYALGSSLNHFAQHLPRPVTVVPF